MRKLLPVLALLGLLAPASALGVDRPVSMQSNSFQPSRTIALTGDRVVWTNSDLFAVHNATGAGWGTGNLTLGQSGSWLFPAKGIFPYLCTLHPFMRGTVEVYDLYFTGPVAPLAYPRRAPLTGLAPPSSSVLIHRVTETGALGEQVAAATAGGDGRFIVSLPSVPARYQAMESTRLSPIVRVKIRPKVRISARRSGSRVFVTVRTSPSQAGAQVLLERKRSFGWERLRSARLNAASKATFRLTPPTTMNVRARLPRGARGYSAGKSATIAVR